MNYIVMDLEWNQSSDAAEVVKSIPFEIVEIGAVKYNQNMEQIGSFSELIKPSVYLQMNQITGELTQLDMTQLMSGDGFVQVMERFLAWCESADVDGTESGGVEDGDVSAQSTRTPYCFCIWGTQDLTELQRNMKFYGMEPLSEGPIPFLDVQKLFSIAYEDRKIRRSLEYAVEFLQISGEEGFHRAYSDAFYTGKILTRCNQPDILNNISFDLFHPPVRREDEIKIQFDTYMKYISRVFADKEEALEDKEVISSKCYLCHRNLRKKLKWFTPNSGRNYYCIAYCEKHGYLKGKIRVRKTDDDKVYVVKTTRFMTEEEANEILDRKEHVRELRRRHRAAGRKK